MGHKTTNPKQNDFKLGKIVTLNTNQFLKSLSILGFNDQRSQQPASKCCQHWWLISFLNVV